MIFNELRRAKILKDFLALAPIVARRETRHFAQLATSTQPLDSASRKLGFFAPFDTNEQAVGQIIVPGAASVNGRKTLVFRP